MKRTPILHHFNTPPALSFGGHSSTLLVAFFIILAAGRQEIKAQETNRVLSLFPPGTVLRGNIPYANDTLKKHLLDIYIPPRPKTSAPLVVWIHGGGWMSNDKYADMGYMKNTVKEIGEDGYVLASIDYRYSTTAIFPALIQDCNQAIEFLYQHAAAYGIDKNKIALIGFSAGGHLASLLGLSNNNNITDFYPEQKPVTFKITGVVDFYGASDLISMHKSSANASDPKNSITLLLGADPSHHSALAKKASPVTYIDKDDPPFLIIQGEKDLSVPRAQSELLSERLSSAHVENKLIVVPGAPHFGEMFDDDYIREEVMIFLDEHLLGVGKR
jgi:acetyl esterase/lipase